jgi:integral membrane protein
MQPVPTFRHVAIAEGISYITLLGVAMPMKYMFDMPLAVRVVGWIHGLLFIAYLAAGHRAATHAQWESKFRLWAIVASLIPFATFVLERQLRDDT